MESKEEEVVGVFVVVIVHLEYVKNRWSLMSKGIKDTDKIWHREGPGLAW